MKLHPIPMEDHGISYVGNWFWCPGCKTLHRFMTGDPEKQGKRPTWAFNGDFETPHFAPSLRYYTTHPDTHVETTICHLNLENGKLFFHGDSPHELKGQTIDLPEIPADRRFWEHVGDASDNGTS